MNSLYAKSCLIIKLVYEIKSKKIRLFSEKFVNNNVRYCKMVINNKICELIDEYETFDDKMKLLKARLYVLNNEKINYGYMFYECDSLIDFSIITKEEAKLKNESISEKEINSNKKINENSLDEAFDKSEFSYKAFIEGYDYQISNNSELEHLYDNLDEYDSHEGEFDEISAINPINKDLPFPKEKELKNHTNKNSLTNKSSIMPSFLKKLKSKSDDYENKNIKSLDLCYMFYGCSSLLNVSGLSKINVSNVVDLSHMFENCSKLQKIEDISQ